MRERQSWDVDMMDTWGHSALEFSMEPWRGVVGDMMFAGSHFMAWRVEMVMTGVAR